MGVDPPTWAGGMDLFWRAADSVCFARGAERSRSGTGG